MNYVVPTEFVFYGRGAEFFYVT